MNRKQLTTLLVLVLVLGGAGLLLRKRQTAAWTDLNPAIGKKLLGDFPVNDVGQIILRQGSNSLTLAKKEDLWRVQERKDYPANYSEISDFLLKARDLKVVQTDQVGPSQLSRFSLAVDNTPNSPMSVELKDASGKMIRQLLLGKKHLQKSKQPSPMGDMGGDDQGWPDGRYVRVGADSGIVSLINDPLTSIEPRPEAWLSKDFFKVEKLKSVTVTHLEATNSWKATRETETGEWKLADTKPEEHFDPSKASALSSALNSPSFTDVVVDPQPQALGLDKPTQIVLETFDHFNYHLKVGTKTNDNYPLVVAVSADLPKERVPGKDEKPEDKAKLDKEFADNQKKFQEKLAQEQPLSSWTYLVSSWTLDSVMKDRASFMADKKEESKPDDHAPLDGTPADVPHADHP
jgi:hypothetical protein